MSEVSLHTGKDGTAIGDGMNSKYEFTIRLGNDWHDLAEVLEIPSHTQRGFQLGGEPYAIWEFLADRRRLKELAPALVRIGRQDLAELVTGSSDVGDGRVSSDDRPDALSIGSVGIVRSGHQMDGQGSVASSRLSWHHLSSPPSPAWRLDLQDRRSNQSAPTAVELHLVPVGQGARLQVRDLAALKSVLPRIGRDSDAFSPTDAVDCHQDADKVVATTASRDRAAGIAVTRVGQRSMWHALPHDGMGAVLDESDLANELMTMIDILAQLPLADPDSVVPFVGVEPALMVTIGRVSDLPRTSARMGLTMSTHLRPTSEDAVAFGDLRLHKELIAAELVARLIVEIQSPARSKW